MFSLCSARKTPINVPKWAVFGNKEVENVMKSSFGNGSVYCFRLNASDKYTDKTLKAFCYHLKPL